MEPHIPEPIDPEDTGVVVMRLHKAKRRLHFRIVMAVLPVAVLGVFWFLYSGQSCGSRFTDQFGLSGGETQPTERKNWIVNPKSKTARVEIELTQEATLWIDEREFTRSTGMVAELKPGEHMIRAIFGNVEMQQLMTVKAGEVFGLTFDRKGRRVSLLRVPPPGTEAQERVSPTGP